MNHATAKIGSLAEQRIADDVEVGVAGQAEALAQGRPAGLFGIYQQFRGIVDPDSGVESEDAGRGFFVMRIETVRPAVKRVKLRVSLNDPVGLSGKPEARVLEMRQHGLGALVGRRIAGRV